MKRGKRSGLVQLAHRQACRVRTARRAGSARSRERGFLAASTANTAAGLPDPQWRAQLQRRRTWTLRTSLCSPHRSRMAPSGSRHALLLCSSTLITARVWCSAEPARQALLPDIRPCSFVYWCGNCMKQVERSCCPTSQSVTETGCGTRPLIRSCLTPPLLSCSGQHVAAYTRSPCRAPPVLPARRAAARAQARGSALAAACPRCAAAVPTLQSCRRSR